jgi:outer membrane protein assembly factor BamB
MEAVNRRRLLAGMAGLGIAAGTGQLRAAAATRTAGTQLWQAATPSGTVGLLAADDVVCATILSPNQNGPAGIYAVHAATGKKAWTQYGDDLLFPFAAGAGMVYSTNIAQLSAVSTATGKVLWNSPQLGLINPGLAPVWGVYDSGAVYTTAQARTVSEVVAIDAQDGKKLWSAPTGGLPTALAVSDGTVYVGWGKSAGIGTLAALDATTGQQLWTTALTTVPGRLTVTASAVAGCTSGLFGNPKKFFTFALDTGTGQQLWQNETNGEVLAMAAGNGVIYTSPNPLAALDALTGTTIWDWPFSVDQAQLLMFDDGVLYASVLPGIRAFAPSTGDLLWHCYLPSPPLGVIEEGAMAVGNGAVYQSLDDNADGKPGRIYAIRA